MSHSTEMDKWSVDVTPVFWHYGQKFTFYVMGDELLLNFGVKFYMWSYKIAMATFLLSQCQDGDEVLNAVNEDDRAQKDTLENLTHKRAHQEGF